MSTESRPRRRRIVGLPLGSLTVLVLVPLALAPSRASGSTPVAAALPAGGASLTAASAALTSLVYDGVVTVSTTAGDVRSLQLSSTSATLTGLSLHVPCQSVDGAPAGVRADLATPSGADSRAEQGLTLYATSVTGTMAGSTVTWTPDNPPPAQDLGDATLGNATIELARLSAPSLTMPGLQQSTSFCGQ